MEEILKKFGRYLLLDKIAQGGMAEIYRACPASIDGAGRLIVIKRIQQSFGTNTEFLQMFKSEIKVTMGFNHQNIVQVYDFGEEEKQPYIAMEFVDGKNLRQFITRTNERKQPFPIDLAAHIISQAASGLHYAHTYKDKISGEHLNIIHRDISPQNILISYDGSVKVIDFGIAKATVNSESTRAGVIKGKPSYLSPEQIHGDVLDARCDNFSLGAVFWELLVGRKLFAGENDLAILKMIESCHTHVKPPSAFRPEIPKELDYIVLRALSKQPDKRHQNAEEFHRALHKFLYTIAPDFNPTDLSYFAKDLFKDQIIEDRKNIQKLNEKAASLLVEVPVRVNIEISGMAPVAEDATRLSPVNKGTASSGARQVADVPTAGKGLRLEVEPGLGVPHRHVSPMQTHGGVATTSQRPEPPRQRTGGRTEKKKGTSAWLVAAVALVAFVLVAPGLGIKLPGMGDARPRPGKNVGVEPPSSMNKSPTLVLDGDMREGSVVVNDREVGRSLPTQISDLPTDRAIKVVVTNAAGEVFEKSLNLQMGEKKRLDVAFTAAPVLDPVNRSPGSKMVTLRLKLFPEGPGASILLNGTVVNPSQPEMRVPLDTALDLTIERPQYKPVRREFVLESARLGSAKEWPMEIALDPIHFGFLSIHSTPSADAIITLGNQVWMRKTPMENEKFPVGTYQIRLVNDLLGMEKKVQMTLPENKVVNVTEQLQVR